MHIDTSTVKGKYTRHLLRDNFREDGKVKHRTVANLSACSAEEIDALKLAFRHKKDLSQLVAVKEEVELAQGASVGAVVVLKELADRLGISEALGPSREGRLALWQVLARATGQGSRLSAVRLARGQAVGEALGLSAFDEDDLYANLDWLAGRQEKIEQKLAKKLHPHEPPRLFLYDVTSSYLEGEQNELAAFGYNRDGKRGKRQIVIGMLCDEAGEPLAVEVFPGNTSDPATFGPQVKKVAERFGGKEVTLVGDRGMIKGLQVKELAAQGFHYITAITKPQIEKMLRLGKFQMELFDYKLGEVEEEGVRYVLRRNPVRAREMEKSRRERQATLTRLVEKLNLHLAGHPRAKPEAAWRKAKDRIRRLKLSGWTTVSLLAGERKLTLSIDPEEQAAAAKLDGCYVLKTDLPALQAGKETVHDRYKDLAHVERGFRTQKTGHLEIRPVHVRTADHTRGHVLVVMLALRLVRELERCWRRLDLTVEEGIAELSRLCAINMVLRGKTLLLKVPLPGPQLVPLLAAAGVALPRVLPARPAAVATKRKLPSRRKQL